MKNIFVNPLKVNYEEREKTVDILKKSRTILPILPDRK